MKIPEHAKKVFKGVLYDVYHWDQELYDGTTKIFEMLKRNPASFVIPISDDGNIYILEQEQPGRQPYYSFPGGSGEDGEDALELAKRELLEETGLVGYDWELFKTYNQSGKIDYEKPCYISRNCKKIQEQELDGGEKIKVIKVNWEEFKTIITGPKFRMSDFGFDFVRELYNGREEELKKKILGK
ncbi:MAG: NUDIX hydrolase [Candidatus Gracilibacteria bacterium]|nr:NUDIX hydrolase [Candidatus Gracilibacteria bacterium]